jgi:hypothetical protein
MSNIHYIYGSRIQTPSTSNSVPIELGDTNGDGVIDILDASNVTASLIWDANQDGIIDILDAAEILANGGIPNTPTTNPTPVDTCPEQYGFERINSIYVNNEFQTLNRCMCKGPNRPEPRLIAPGITKDVCVPCKETDLQSAVCAACVDYGYGVLVTIVNYDYAIVSCESVFPHTPCQQCITNEEGLSCPFTDCEGQPNKWYNPSPRIGGGCFSSETTCYYETVHKFYEQFEYHYLPESFGRNGTYRSNLTASTNPYYNSMCDCFKYGHHNLALLRAIEREQSKIETL